MAKKIGRPPKAKKERKSFMLRVRMTQEERKMLAGASGGNMSEWARKVLLRAAKRKLK